MTIKNEVHVEIVESIRKGYKYRNLFSQNLFMKYRTEPAFLPSVNTRNFFMFFVLIPPKTSDFSFPGITNQI